MKKMHSRVSDVDSQLLGQRVLVFWGEQRQELGLEYRLQHAVVLTRHVQHDEVVLEGAEAKRTLSLGKKAASVIEWVS